MKGRNGVSQPINKWKTVAWNHDGPFLSGDSFESSAAAEEEEEEEEEEEIPRNLVDPST